MLRPFAQLAVEEAQAAACFSQSRRKSNRRLYKTDDYIQWEYDNHQIQTDFSLFLSLFLKRCCKPLKNCHSNSTARCAGLFGGETGLKIQPINSDPTTTLSACFAVLATLL